jgi:rare lipoprotein A
MMRFLLFLISLCPASVNGQNDSLLVDTAKSNLATIADTSAYVETGIASWYGKNAEGNYTASGEIFYADSMTAAHKTLPLGTLVRVTNLKNDSVVIVKINDRLPKTSTSRCIDLSSGAARKLGYLRDGITPVKIEVIGMAEIKKVKRKK